MSDQEPELPWKPLSPLARFSAIVGMAIITAAAFGGMLAGLHALSDIGRDPTETFKELSAFYYSPFFVVVPVLIALTLFRLRGSAPLPYGLLEVLVGLGTLAVLAAQKDANLLQHALALTGGTYVLIRGMDNIERGLPPRHRARWQEFFPKKL
jgi:hypothetical protein